MAGKVLTTKRKDKDRIVLKTGEGERPNGLTNTAGLTVRVNGVMSMQRRFSNSARKRNRSEKTKATASRPKPATRRSTNCSKYGSSSNAA